MTTFISFIGKGKHVEGERFRYENATYLFGDVSIEASCFASAVIQSGKYSFDRVCIIGTDSSTYTVFGMRIN